MSSRAVAVRLLALVWALAALTFPRALRTSDHTRCRPGEALDASSLHR
jgi:hypothetical protein